MPEEQAVPHRLEGPLLTAVVVMLAFLTLPLAVTERTPDASLNGVLHYAWIHGLQFGAQLVSTYGPLGFLIFPQYAEHASAARTVTDVALCFAVAAGLCLVAWRRGIFWGLLLPALFAWVAANVWLRTDLVLQSGLFCWGLLSLVESGRRLTVAVLIFGLLTAFCALAKVTLLFLGMAGLAVIIARLIMDGRHRLAMAAPGVFLLAFGLGWIAAGQSPGNLGLFVMQALEVAGSYNAALGVEGLQSVRPFGIAIVITASAALLLRASGVSEPGRRSTARFVSTWAFLFLAASWKHGFVRGDTYHVGFFLGFVPLVMMGVEVVPTGRGALGISSRALGAASGIVALAVLQIFAFPPLPGSLAEPLALFRSNARRLVRPVSYAQVAGAALGEVRLANQLPKIREITGQWAVDVFGQQQAWALDNGLNYRPRPVLQSYSACNPALMRLNEDFFFSSAAPEYWLLGLSPTDRKFAALEDAMLFRDLLLNCRLAAVEQDCVLLRKESAARPRFALLKEGLVHPGEPIDVRQWSAGALWLEIKLEPSPAGRLRQTLFRPPVLRLAAWREPGKGLLYRRQAAAPMLEGGFLASPLLVRTADVASLYEGKEPVRPGAYSVEAGEGRMWWKEQAQFRLYRLGAGGALR